MAALPEYKFGKVEGLTPDLRVISERSESPMVCCGYCSAHMAASTAKAGLSTLMTNEAHAIRKAGGRPHNNGNTATELREGTAKALNVVLKSVAITDIPQRLKDGFAVTAGIQYARLPLWLKVQSNDFGHAVCLFGYDAPTNRVGMFDPLWQQGARGAWVPWVSMREALWPNGNHSTTTVRMVSVGGEGMGIYWNPSRWKAGKDIPVFTDTTWKDQVTTIKKGSVFTAFGPIAVTDSDGKNTSGRSVLVNTGGLVPGSADAAVKAILWAKGSDFPANSESTSQDWDDSIWRLATDPTGRYPAPPCPECPDCPDDGDADCSDEVTAAVMNRDDEWERALKHGEPWPGQ